jgi:hypothetical protein
MPNKLVTTRKKKLVTPIVPTKIVEPVVEVITQSIKPTRVPLRYPCIISSSFEHYAPNCPIKTKFRTCFKLSQPLLPM